MPNTGSRLSGQEKTLNPCSSLRGLPYHNSRYRPASTGSSPSPEPKGVTNRFCWRIKAPLSEISYCDSDAAVFITSSPKFHGRLFRKDTVEAAVHDALLDSHRVFIGIGDLDGVVRVSFVVLLHKKLGKRAVRGRNVCFPAKFVYAANYSGVWRKDIFPRAPCAN